MPAGKITRTVSVLICRHFKEGGLPPKFCADADNAQMCRYENVQMNARMNMLMYLYADVLIFECRALQANFIMCGCAGMLI